MKKALIIGASGLVGNALYKTLSAQCQVKGTYCGYPSECLVRLDISNKPAVEKIIKDFNPDYVFLPAAMTNVDLCEDNKDVCMKVNVGGVKNVIDAVKSQSSKLIYFSTEYVFDGKNGPYSETDIPNPINAYGKAKLEAEKNIISELKNYLIIRTTGIYGWEPQGKNFVMGLIRRNRLKETVKVPLDQISTPTYVQDLANVSWKLANFEKCGIYNVAGISLINRLEFTNSIADEFGLDKKLINAVKTEDLKQKAVRPLNGGLKTDKISNELNIHMSSVAEGLKLMKRSMPDGYAG